MNSEYVPVLEAAKKLRRSWCRWQYEFYGMCYYFEHECLEQWSQFTHAGHFKIVVQKWGKSGGYEILPVPDPNYELDNVQVYLKTKLKWRGRYGKLRLELLDYLIDYLECLCKPRSWESGKFRSKDLGFYSWT